MNIISKNRLVKLPIMVALLLIFSLFLIAAPVAIAATAPRSALADVNRDGLVSRIDLNFILKNFGSSPIGQPALADVDQNGRIDLRDFTFVASRLGRKVSACQMADINNDHRVNQADLDIIANYYNQVANSTNMIADLTGDGLIDLFDVTRAGGLYDCQWTAQ